ncbi:MAG: hypothetical protein PHE60_11935 [Sulfurospirillaceae bacterium]|nr:hypothetical protein [Sulfurospirillaceae bacterium]
MSTSYKPLVERFLIPRPTLIEWQKRAEGEKDNWRVKHLEYLRIQLLVEKETLQEIQHYALCAEDLFILSVHIFFQNINHYIAKDKLRQGLREFALHVRAGVEYQHDFAQRIWSLRVGDESNKKIVNYYRAFDVLDRLSAAQYALLISHLIDFVKMTKKKYKIETKTFLEGKTWQELFTYDKAFSIKAVEEYFKSRKLLV